MTELEALAKELKVDARFLHNILWLYPDLSRREVEWVIRCYDRSGGDWDVVVHWAVFVRKVRGREYTGRAVDSRIAPRETRFRHADAQNLS